MSTREDPADEQREAFETRLKLIDDATNRLYAAVVADQPDQGLPAAFALLKCGLMALTEIADAQQRMVILAERDVAAEIEAAVEDAAEAKAAEMHKNLTKRSYIGQKHD